MVNHCQFHKILLYHSQKVVIAENDWSKSLADFIRNNDKPIIEACDKLLGVYQDEMLPCESFSEFCDVVGKFYWVITRSSLFKVAI